ncbi:hypothetical protein CHINAEXTREME_01970 [Halobiforma lacisalsi AJ5]|uniref:Uncharacterized protein n=1 Tax=Natronobacterium lacisalsi AJ5 TaxID=358396 RepID=M0LEY0_NATLA|nr:hypothetical protein [Halobiforma lacisalsi]APW96611.1 hypothetical protein CHINAEXTREME_01970 [Halobiforma lacisalsi AJ5]EMA32106.1 hypothetical protein C445_12366 [Halobiforma lacisalsi AJ5]
MSDSGEIDESRLSRRTVLRAVSGTVALSVAGSGRVSASGSGSGSGSRGDLRSLFDGRCPDATLQPSMGYCADSSTAGCTDDHPETVELQRAVRTSLETQYPDVGALVDAGFRPYFDVFGGGEGWSHWLSPAHIGDEGVVDPERPEAVLVDNDSWRSIGVMFIATRDGERVEPPTIYDADGAVGGDDHGDASGHGKGHEEPPANDPSRCAPWHYHAGLPGRFAWWFYQQVYAREAGGDVTADTDVAFPCRTPCMMHVWIVDHPEGVYAHDGPPPEYRQRPPAEDPGFETDATPGEDELGWDVLPDEVVPDRKPKSFAAFPFDR